MCSDVICLVGSRSGVCSRCRTQLSRVQRCQALHRGYAVQEQGIHSARNALEPVGKMEGRPLESRPGLAALVVCQRDSDKARRRASGVVVGVESLHGRTGEFGFEKPPARFSSGPPRSRLSLQSCQVRGAHSTENRAGHHRHRYCVLSM